MPGAQHAIQGMGRREYPLGRLLDDKIVIVPERVVRRGWVPHPMPNDDAAPYGGIVRPKVEGGENQQNRQRWGKVLSHPLILTDGAGESRIRNRPIALKLDEVV